MSTSISSAAPAPASPSRSQRPPHPRPTTYSGSSVPPSSSAGPSSSSGPPIPPPPRTSSKSSSTPPDSRGNPRGGSDGAQDRERSERDRERERADREKRRQQEERARQEANVGRSNSSRGGSSSRGASSGMQQQQSQQDGSRSGSRRRQDSEAGSRRGGSSTSTGSTLHVVNGNEGDAPPPSIATASSRRATRKETRFGEYILGQTLGEGEFGKVKLGWRRDGGVQVAIKLIRRDSISPHPNRISKIYREIAILRTLSHPNIVRLHEMVETDRHIGIILEYASGGELFDYILTHRYLKDPPACRLFAQLVSGVGYLHKKGIVHRDLKLENLLLDRNRNIIITDFGFANVFDPTDELGELEDRLEDPAVIKELEKGVPHTDRKPDGSSLLSIVGPGQIRRRGDLMATSCGSPCYAAPELVVSDGLYTGRKVDVWSCGVILYAMLAGYLPFDDDPANPEGDNINLLYKYIVSTPLTFPEYVTPHARDLLRRILVPDPRRRADLFEVARHSWLSPFADIVSKVTSATTGIKDVETVTVREPKPEAPGLGRSHSVREPSSASHPHAPGALGARHHAHEQIAPPTQAKPSSDNKRRTVQVEYVEPQTQTKRGSAVDPDDKDEDDAAPPPVVSQRKERETGNVARAATTAGTTPRTFENFRDQREARNIRESPKEEPKLQAPEKGKTRPISYAYQQSTAASRAAAMDGPTSGPSSSRSSKDRTGPSVSGTTTKPVSAGSGSGESGTRPNTANSLGSTRLPSHGGYSQPAAPSVAANNVQGRMASNSKGKGYQISAPIPQADGASPDFAADNRPVTQPDQVQTKGHKRANTVGGVGGSSRLLSGFMGGSSNTDRPDVAARPPVVGGSSSTSVPRQSLDQGRGGKMDKSGKSRRFSLLPTSFSLRNMTGEGKHERKLSRSNSRQYASNSQQTAHSQPTLGVPGNNNDDASHMSGSEASMAPGSAPPSAFRDSVDTNPIVVPPAKKSMLSKHRKFDEAPPGSHAGSSGPARRVMDFFRRRGTARIKGEKAEK